MHSPILLLALAGISSAMCPHMQRSVLQDHQDLARRDGQSAPAATTEQFLSQFYLNDNNIFVTTDVGGPISDQNSLSVGDRGPTLLEDFIFRQKIQRFDHERVCSRSQHVTEAPLLMIHGLLTAPYRYLNEQSMHGVLVRTPSFSADP
jgi:catalase